MRHSQHRPATRPRRGRRLAAAALAVGRVAATTVPTYSITMLTLARR